MTSLRLTLISSTKGPCRRATDHGANPMDAKARDTHLECPFVDGSVAPLHWGRLGVRR